MAATCRNFNGAMYRWHRNPSVLDSKMDGGTIFVFSIAQVPPKKKKKWKLRR
jgi:hypothetical protein